MKKMTREELTAKLQNAESVVQQLIGEFINLKDLAIGTMELVKELPDYDLALESLKNKIQIQADIAKAKLDEPKLELPDEPKLEE